MNQGRKSTAQTLAPATMSESDGVRYLHLGTPWVQGAMRMGAPRALELEYVQRMMAWLLLRESEQATQGHVVQLGLGAGSLARFCHGILRMRTTVVEINPAVIGVCRMYFHLPADGKRFQVLQQDAARFADDAQHAGTADVLCVDLYDHDAAAPVLDDEAFYRACHGLLADAGVMSVNLFGRDASFARSAARIEAAFGAGRVATLNPTREGNSIVLAVKGDAIPPRQVLAQRAANLETRFTRPDLPARKWLRLFKPWPPAPAPDPAPAVPDSSA